MNFKRTTAVNIIADLANNHRKLVIQGGTSAGKTYAILAYLINLAIKVPNTDISIVSESIPHLRRGCMKDFIRIMQATGRWRDEAWNRSHLTYAYSSGSTIEFFSAEQEDKLRGARRRVLYVNEANNIKFEAFHQMSIRTSGKQFIDFNPTAEFWAHRELVGQNGVGFTILNYTHNEALPSTIVADIEAARDKAATSEYWANWWRVYGLGEVGSLQGVIFNNWTQIEELPKDAKLLGIGLDFGFTNDPTAAVAVYQHNGQYIIDEVIYETGLLNSDIAERLKGFTCTVVADSAEPKSIEEIRRHGIRIKGATKGTDSIRFGIQLMQEQQWLVTAHSTNVIKELRAYSWETDKTGKQTGNPIGTMNHACDAWRYWSLDNLHKSFTGQYMIA
jgi:phage terminase large subunit